MLVINYNGNKPTTDYFKYSVQGNNNADVVRFCLSKQQGTLDLTNYKVYVQAKCEEDDFIDKVEITDDVSIVANQLNANWVMLKKHTINRQLLVSLSFENENEEVVWQTQIVKITIANGINADEEIANTYPSVIQDLIKNKVYDISDDYSIKPISEVYAKVGKTPFYIYDDFFRLEKQENKYLVLIVGKSGYGEHLVDGETTIESIFDGDPFQETFVKSGEDFNEKFDERLTDRGFDYTIGNFRIEKVADDEIEIHFPKGIMIKEIVFDIGDKSYDLVFTAYNVSNLRSSGGTAELGMESLFDETYTDESHNFVDIVFSSHFDTTQPVKVRFIQYEKILGMAEI